MAEQRGAWHGDPDLKATVVERMKKHREADAFVQGVYQLVDPDKALGYKGCALGCMVPQRDDDTDDRDFNEAVEEAFGIPVNLADAIDETFESLAFKDCAEFAVSVVEAIPAGADLAAAGDLWWQEWHGDPDAIPLADRLLALIAAAPQVSQ